VAACVGLLLVLGFSWWGPASWGAGLAARLALLLLVPALLLLRGWCGPAPARSPADPVRLCCLPPPCLQSSSKVRIAGHLGRRSQAAG